MMARAVDPPGLSVGLGIFTGQTLPGSPITVADEYETLLALAEAAEEQGYDSIWLSEHHFADDNYMPSLLPMLAALAVRTRRLGLGTAVLLPSLMDPVRLAEDVATIDQLSRGRVRLGLGLGWRREEFAAFGVPLQERAARTAEAIALLRHLWRDDSAPFEGRFRRLERPRLRPLPYAAGGPPIYLAGAKEAAIRRSGRISDGLIYSVTGHTASRNRPDVGLVSDAIATFDGAHPAAGPRRPLVLFFNAFVADGDPWRIIGPGVDHQFETYARWKKEEAGEPFGEPDRRAATQAGRQIVMAGSPSHVAERLGHWVRAFAKQRAVHLVVKLHYPGMERSRTIDAMAMFAREVVPVLRSEVGTGSAEPAGSIARTRLH